MTLTVNDTQQKIFVMFAHNLCYYWNIASFDWNGNPDTLYKTDYRVRSVCEQAGKLYVILEDKTGRCLIARTEK